MSEFKRQHYVPQFYLRLFSEDGEYINAYNLKSKEAFPVAIRRVCQERYFYGENAELEKAISQLEQMQARVLKRIADISEGGKLTGEDYFTLLTFVTFQLARTKESKVMNEKLLDWFLESFFKPMMKSNPDLDISDDTIDGIRIKWPGLFGLTLSYGLVGVCGVFDLKPVMIVNETERRFITSDAPVVKNNNLKLGNLSLGGTQSPGLQIFCPISPRLALLLYDQDMYLLKGNSPAIAMNKDSDVDSMNKLQLLNCLENVFFSEKPDEPYIKKLHRKHQHLARGKEIESSMVETRKNVDGTFSEIVKFSTENIRNRARFSFLKIHRHNYLRLRRQYNHRSKQTKVFVPVRNEELTEMMRTKMKDIDQGQESDEKD